LKPLHALVGNLAGGRLISGCVLLFGLHTGCQKLIGLDDRSLQADVAPEVTAPKLQCEEYCSNVLDACSGSNPAFVSSVDGSNMESYASEQFCLSVCEHLDARADPDGNQNTLVCRLKNARLASDLPASELGFYCSASGPGGGAPGSTKNCGTNCQGYCSLYRSICDDGLDRVECERQCSALRDNGVVNADSDFMNAPDSIQCRLAHLSVAATIQEDRQAHCDHARLVPRDDDSFGCDLGVDTAPRCDDYCKLVGVACADPALAVYESKEQCMAVCGVLPAGKAKETTGNSVACRRWRAYSALVDPAPHCGNAGPASNEPCGDPCDAYCALAKAGCESSFAGTFPSMAECHSQCRLQSFSGSYLVSKARGNTLECRLLNAARAKAGDASACPSALGRGECQ
jgi:hypothetical protein